MTTNELTPVTHDVAPRTAAPTFAPTAQWIWGGDDQAERNRWRYFRGHFTPPAGLRRATLLLTADSRYECSINGRYIGRGPARGFPFAYSYDVYDITSDLRLDEDNMIAVLVNHLADHTMSYIPGRAGLLCEIVVEDAAGNETRYSYGKAWRTAVCATFNNDAPRIATQQEFEEQYDARQETAGWDQLEFDDTGWAPAVEIGPAGSGPWTALLPRTIPFLTEDMVWPVEIKVVELARISPGVFWTLDVRYEAGSERTGQRAAPPGERGLVLFTEVFAAHETTVRIHNFPNY